MSLLESFIHSSDQVVEFQAFFVDIPMANHTVHTLHIYKDEILRYWAEFRSAHNKLLKNFNTTKQEVDLETIKERFLKTFDTHVKALAKANEILDSLQPKAEPAVTSPPISNDLSPNISLPPCDTQTFYGDYVL